MTQIVLRQIAYARSGDKGSDANIGVIARLPKYYPFLVETLTAQLVEDFIRPLGARRVVRYELPNLSALNFICCGVLAGGASLSLRTDAQGKVLGQALLELPLEIVNIEEAWMRDLSR